MANEAPLVYIVMLNWNGLEVSTECLRSVGKMTYPNYRIIVVDNGSTDGSADELLRIFPHILLIKLEENRGFTGGCNVGIRKAIELGAKYVLLLNNDTTVAADLLDLLIAAAEADETVAVINPKILFADRPDRIWYAAGSYNWWLGMPSYHYKQKDSPFPTEPQYITFATGCAMLLRVAALRQVGLFDERFFGYAEDVDLVVRLLHAGYRALYVPTARVLHKDEYTYSRLPRPAAKTYLSTRNKLLLMAKHARPWQWLVFLPSFCIRHVLFYVLLGIWRRNPHIFPAILAGIRDFFQVVRRPPCEPLVPG